MVHSIIEGPARPGTRTSLSAHPKRRRDAWNHPRISATTAHTDGLDWDHFRDLYYPDSRRHNLEAIVAYGDYKRTPRPRGGGQAAPSKAAISADWDSLGAWEDEGGSRDSSREAATDD
jgi:hypothetical protein